VFLAGVPVADKAVLQLARSLREAAELDTADKLERAWSAEDAEIALETDDRDAILRVLEDGPDELAELRDVLLQEHERRRAGGH
jgi:hypothetical protein